MTDFWPQLEQRAQALGFNMVGVVTAVPSPNLHAYLNWIDAEMHGQMGYLARPDRLARRQDLNVILPGVQTIICVGLAYSTVPLPPAIAHDPSRGRISNYAWGVDYHDVMTPRLEELATWLKAQENHSDVATKVYVDTGAILERDHAAAAGLGFTWLATVPPTAAIVGKLFGVRYLATLFGLTLLSHQIGGFLGAYLGGIAITAQGDYAWMWYADMALAAAAALCNLPIREAKVEAMAVSTGG